MVTFSDEYARRRTQWSDIVDYRPRLYAEATRCPNTWVIEVGTRTGNSTAAFLAAAEAVGGHVWSVDVADPEVPEWWFGSPLWTSIVGDDLAIAAPLPDGVEVILVDTTHTDLQTVAELPTYAPKLGPGGTLLCHDTELERPELGDGEDPFPVRRAIEAFRTECDVECEYVWGCHSLAVLRRRSVPDVAKGDNSRDDRLRQRGLRGDQAEAAHHTIAFDVSPAVRLRARGRRQQPSAAAVASRRRDYSSHDQVNLSWIDGRNLYYEPALNLTLERATGDLFIYVCSSHGKSNDPTWLGDLLLPLLTDSIGNVAMTGCLRPSGPPSIPGFADSLLWMHVQKGVFAARGDVLRANPYLDGQFAHCGSDIYQSLDLVHSGYRLVDVPTVKSVGRTRVGKGWWKFVHDES